MSVSALAITQAKSPGAGGAFSQQGSTGTLDPRPYRGCDKAGIACDPRCAPGRCRTWCMCQYCARVVRWLACSILRGGAVGVAMGWAGDFPTCTRRRDRGSHVSGRTFPSHSRVQIGFARKSSNAASQEAATCLAFVMT